VKTVSNYLFKLLKAFYMEIRISTKYKHSSDYTLLGLTGRISDSMKDNPKLPDPTPTQAAFEAARQAFETALNKAGRKDRTLLAIKNEKKAVLIELMDQLAEYVTIKSNGDKIILLSSGFDIAGIKNDSQNLPPIAALIVDIGLPGQATTRVNRVAGARSYIHQYTTDPLTPNSVWVSETITERQHTFTGLQSVTRYWFRVIAIGRNRQSVYSPSETRVIQ
jgi:hypothetical protein